MAFETDRTGFDLLDEGCRSMCMTFAEKPDVDGQAFGGTQHHLDVPRTGRNGCGVCAIGGSDATADEGRDAIRKSGVDLLRRHEMDVRVDAARRPNAVLARYGIGRVAHRKRWRDAAHCVRIA